MAFEQKDGFGALFINDKDGNDLRPDYQGNCKIGGVEYRLAGWKKEGAKGNFISLKIEVPREQSDAPVVQEPADELDDDIGF